MRNSLPLHVCQKICSRSADTPRGATRFYKEAKSGTGVHAAGPGRAILDGEYLGGQSIGIPDRCLGIMTSLIKIFATADESRVKVERRIGR